MNAARTKSATTATVDGRHAQGLFLEWSAGLDKTMSVHFDATMKKLNDNKTAGFWFKEISHEPEEDRYVYDHSFRVAELALMLAKEMELCQIIRTNIHRGAYLHDIGKLGILSSILEKNEKLTQGEYLMICKPRRLEAIFWKNLKTYASLRKLYAIITSDMTVRGILTD